MSSTDHFPCHSCGTLTHIDDLDGKPEPRVGGRIYNATRRIWLSWTGRPTAAWDDPEGLTDWTRLECGQCYGPGYVSNARTSR
ncbi:MULTISPECIES: hypothetical protein [unclassified Bradyrhizobium]|uniref:hypothetical protein n=1 Tax=unclassified Bradyrhizobium TaxID=2631580 RepID=UPI002916A3C1|nr:MULTISPECIES: hypothetical protein [unclassified Bradyrhizobium]